MTDAPTPASAPRVSTTELENWQRTGMLTDAAADLLDCRLALARAEAERDEAREQRAAAIREAGLRKYDRSWSDAKTDEELAESFKHMGWGDGDDGTLMRHVSYAEAGRIIVGLKSIAERDRMRAALAGMNRALCELMNIDGSPESLDLMRVGIIQQAGSAPDAHAAEAAMRCVESIEQARAALGPADHAGGEEGR